MLIVYHYVNYMAIHIFEIKLANLRNVISKGPEL